MEPKSLLQRGELGCALAELKKQVAAKPQDTSLRWFLFQLFCFGGEWKRARDQLSLIGQMDRGLRASAMVYERLLIAEELRGEILSGRRMPHFLGEPSEWVAWIMKANRLLSDGQVAASTELRAKAFEEMPAVGGRINGQEFSWICDQDTRIGAQLECFIRGSYYWLSIEQIRGLIIDSAPKTHTDVLYPQAQLTLRNEGRLDVMLFGRYALSGDDYKDAVLLNRLTEWEDVNDLTLIGSGQRTLCTDQGAYAILELRTLEID